MADPDASDAPTAASVQAPPRPSQISLEAPAAAPTNDVDVALPHGCPFLLAEHGGWRLDVPTRDHRCAAVSPPAALAPEKQARLCLTAAHLRCATYLASMSARGTRIGTPPEERATRWGIARTTTVIEDAGGVRSRVSALLLDRGRWPAVPAVILVVTLIVLAVSGLRGGGATAVATVGPTHATTAPAPTNGASRSPTAVPTASVEPTGAPTSAPTTRPSPTPAGTTGPTATFRTYKVKSGDTLSSIAGKYSTTSSAIATLNGITVGSTLHIGQVLKIPNT